MFNLSIQNEEAVTCVIPEGRLDTLNSTVFGEKLQLIPDQMVDAEDLPMKST